MYRQVWIYKWGLFQKSLNTVEQTQSKFTQKPFWLRSICEELAICQYNKIHLNEKKSGQDVLIKCFGACYLGSEVKLFFKILFSKEISKLEKHQCLILRNISECKEGRQDGRLVPLLMFSKELNWRNTWQTFLILLLKLSDCAQCQNKQCTVLVQFQMSDSKLFHLKRRFMFCIFFKWQEFLQYWRE